MTQNLDCSGGHLTNIPTESVYSSVVSLQGIRLLVFLAELNGLQAWATDILSACLQAKMKEKLYVIAGSEFGDLEDTPCLCTRHFTAYAPRGFDGMNGWQTAFETWDFAHAGRTGHLDVRPRPTLGVHQDIR